MSCLQHRVKYYVISLGHCKMGMQSFQRLNTMKSVLSGKGGGVGILLVNV
jgi:hypothetical protein